jgi:hypothetical protein
MVQIGNTMEFFCGAKQIFDKKEIYQETNQDFPQNRVIVQGREERFEAIVL